MKQTVTTLNPHRSRSGDLPVAVVGAGVVGLWIAEELIDAGIANVTVISDLAPHATVSAVAAGLIEPVAGPDDPAGRERELELFGISMDIWAERQRRRPDLIMWRRVTSYTQPRDAPLPWHDAVLNYRELPEAERHPRYRFHSAAQFETVVVDTPRWLAAEVEALTQRGVTFVHRHVESLDELDEFAVVFNATGLGAAALVGDDELYRGDGHLCVVERPAGFSDVFIEETRDPAETARDPFQVDMRYAIPRADDVVLGGTLKNSRDVTKGPDPIAGIADHIRRLLVDLLPELAVAKPIAYRFGARPRRMSGTRLELEMAGSVRVVHAYGTGGSGWTLAPGLAREAVALVAQEIGADQGARIALREVAG